VRAKAPSSLVLVVLACLVAACDAGSPNPTTSGSSTGSTTSGAGGAGGAGGVGGAIGAGGAIGVCSSCAGACVDLANDPANCGACGHACGPSHPLCDRGQCKTAPCEVVGPICPTDLLCCGEACCPSWKSCCNVPGKASPQCLALDGGACPTTCADCP
jgi:hypothetical protein